ncbi:MAG: type II secretion system F family protein [Verrucomicrobiota bacterium]
MPAFHYEAATLDGRKTSGSLDAADRRDALMQLDRMDLQPITLTQKGKITEVATEPGVPKLNSKQIILFTEDLCDLLESGLQLDPAVAVLEKRQSSSAIRSVASRIRKQLREGHNFSNALAFSSPSFSQLYCSIAEAGETGGILPRIMRQHVIFLHALSELRSKAIQALIYPAFILLAGCLVLVLFVTQLVPQLESLFGQTGKEPPVLTQMLMGISSFMLQYWWLLAAAAFIGFTGFQLAIQSESGKFWWGRTRQTMPGFGPIMKAHFLAQFSKTLGSLLANGIPLLAALKLVRNGITNPYYAEALDRGIRDVGDGASLSMALKKTDTFPALFLDLVTVGEQTGQLARSLEKASERFEKEMDVKIRQLIAMIGPAVIILLAFIVGVVTYSVVTSIFEAVQGVRSRF